MALLDWIQKVVDYYFLILPRKRPNKKVAAKTCLIAHRGAHDKTQGVIENTNAAFERALTLGCWGIELDVQVTKDKVLVVNHDASLLRLWGINHAISELTFQSLRSLAPQIPSLSEVISHYGKRLHLFIEIKAPFFAEKELLHNLKMLEPRRDYHLISLDESVLSKLSEFPRKSMLLVAGHNNVNRYCKLSLEKKYGGVLGHYVLLHDKAIKPLLLANQQIGLGLVNSKFGLYRELNRGLSWIFSDNVTVLTNELELLRQN